MGWRLRKSINLGLGFRINLSKTGIGYSWGFPGYRITKMANGGNRTTYSLPGTGISYVEQNGGSKKATQQVNDNLLKGDTTFFENVPIDDIKKKDPIINSIRKITYLNRLSNILLLGIVAGLVNENFYWCFLVGLGLKIYLICCKKVKLYYEFDDSTRKMYNSLKEVLILLSQSKRLWQISSSEKVYNRKYNANSGSNVERNSAYIINKLPWYIATNINVYGIHLKNQKLFFTPDRIIVINTFGGVFGCTYNDMVINLISQRFVESEGVPSDAQVVDETWQYANSNGDRDLRFSRNKRYPVCKYGCITLSSPNGINTKIHFSNHDTAEDIQSNLLMFGNEFNKILAETKKGESKEVSKETNKKTVITSVEDLEPKSTEKEIPIMHYDYVKPSVELLENDEKNIIKKNIDNLQKDDKVLIPIGINRKELIVEDIKSMPNMLIGGTVMSGKTTYINTVLTSLLLTKTPNELKMIIYDAKKIDYAIFNNIPHLLTPIINDSKKLLSALEKAMCLIESRVAVLSETGCKSIDSYNLKNENKLPSILIVIDDYSSLNNSDEINDVVEKITSNGWKVNVFMMITANHPSAKIISTISKANFPARMSFKVVNAQSSQMILDEPGAEKLKGFNALYTSKNYDKLIEVEVPTLSDSDIERVVSFIKEKNNALPKDDSFLNINKNKTDDSEKDVLYDQVLNYAIRMGQISASLIQRKFAINYNRAARIMDMFEARGIVGPAKGSKPRDVLVRYEDSED